MTAASLMYFADRVTICSDTRVYDDLGSAVGHAGKVYPIPHLRALFFGRGKLSITSTIVVKLLLSPQLHTFDDAAAALSDLYQAVTDEWCEATGFDRTGQPLHECCCFAGWSEMKQQVRLAFASSIDDFALHFQESFGGPIALPRVPASFIPPAKASDSPDARLRDTLLGIDRWCAENPKEANGLRLGGQMLAMDLTEAGITTRTIGSFDALAKQQSTAGSKRTASRKSQRAAHKRRR